MPLLQPVTDSILAADIGSVWTRVLLVDRVGGAYRFVARGDAPTTAEAPHRDVTIGLRAATRQLEAATGRALLDATGNLIVPEGAEGEGVDGFVVSSSAAPPLKVAVGGLGEFLSAASARRAALGTYSEVAGVFALDAAEGRWGTPRGALGVAERLRARWPDAIVLAGGTDGSADRDLLELADAIGLALAASPDPPPPAVVFAGNGALQGEVQARLGAATPLMVSDNVLPAPGAERLRTTGRLLDQQFRSRCLSRLPGAGALRAWRAMDPVPTAEALARVVQFLALRGVPPGAAARRVLGVDVGGGSCALAVTFADRVAQTLVRADLGLAFGAEALLAAVGAEGLAGWVPGDIAADEVANQFLTLSLHPAQRPMAREALWTLQAAAREALRLTLADAAAGWAQRGASGLTPPFDLILGAGAAIREAPLPEQALLLLLDALQPVGVVEVQRDHLGLVAAVGALADVDPQAAADLLEAQGFERLGTVIAPFGEGRPGDEAVRYRLTQGDGVTEGTAEWGQLVRFPTRQATQLELRPARRVDLGRGAGVAVTLSSEGDSVGFVLDARGRPLPRPADLQMRRELAGEWMRYVGG